MKKMNIALGDDIIVMLEEIAAEMYNSKTGAIKTLIKREYDKELQKQINELRVLNNELLDKNRKLTNELIEKDKRLKERE